MLNETFWKISNIVSSLRSRLDRPSRVAVIFFCLVGKILMVLLLLCWQLKSPGSLLAFVFFFHLCHFSSLASTWSWPWNKMCELFVLQCCLTVFFSNQFSSGRQEDFFQWEAIWCLLFQFYFVTTTQIHRLHTCNITVGQKSLKGRITQLQYLKTRNT